MSAITLADESWIIAANIDTSGSSVDASRAIRAGIELALEDINAEGGVLGKPLELKLFDHRNNPSRAVANYQTIASMPSVVAVVGGDSTPTIGAQLSLISEQPKIYLLPWSAGNSLTESISPLNPIFRVSLRDQWVGHKLLEQAHTDGCNDVTLLLLRSNWGTSNELSMSAASEELGLPIRGVEWFNFGSQVFSELIPYLAGSGATCLVLAAPRIDAVAVIEAILDLPESQLMSVYSHLAVSSDEFVEAIGVDRLSQLNLKFVQTLSFGEPKTSKGQEIIERLQASGELYSVNGVHGVAHSYDVVRLFAQAMNNAGSSNVEDIVGAMESLVEYDGAMKRYQQPFADDHEGLDASDLLILRFNAEGVGVVAD